MEKNDADRELSIYLQLEGKDEGSDTDEELISFDATSNVSLRRYQLIRHIKNRGIPHGPAMLYPEAWEIGFSRHPAKNLLWVLSQPMGVEKVVDSYLTYLDTFGISKFQSNSNHSISPYNLDSEHLILETDNCVSAIRPLSYTGLDGYARVILFGERFRLSHVVMFVQRNQVVYMTNKHVDPDIPFIDPELYSIMPGTARCSVDLSHLCHHKDCMNAHHLLFESHFANMSRNACQNVQECKCNLEIACLFF